MTQTDFERRHDDAEAHIRTTIINELCAVMSRTNLPPMAVLRLAARSIGTIYREMAEAHSGIDSCPCGWRPDPASDMEALRSALVAASDHRRAGDLRLMQVAGSA